MMLIITVSEVDLGELYQNDKFVVNVKAEHQIYLAMKRLNILLLIHLSNCQKNELAWIWRVNVYNSFKEIYCQSDDILFYSDTDICVS